jgi:membrane-bound lytic murein transglycosylase D
MRRRRFLLLAGLAAGAAGARAADPAWSLDDLVREGRRLADEALDPGLAALLPDPDDPRIRRLLAEIERRFAGEYVLDLAALRDTASALTPLLEAHADTRPYGAWLRTRLDYFEVADELNLRLGPPPAAPSGRPAPPRPAPTLEIEREVWRERVAGRSPPRGAAGLARTLRPLFTRQDVPGPLVWLAEIESSFNPAAHSPAGAVGLYQLMPATARELGLRTAPRDERLDPHRNADAAARHLRRLHLRFRDWPLTLAAYNAGEGRVGTLLKQARGRTFADIRRRLPAETQLYVPKFEAVLKRRENLELARLPPVRA